MLLIAFCGNIYSFCELILPKISSRLDHNKSKQIQGELRAASQKPEGKRSRKQKKKDHKKIFQGYEIFATGKISQVAKFASCHCSPHAIVHLSCHCSPFLLFDVLTFLLHFFVSSQFVPCNSFCFWFFGIL